MHGDTNTCKLQSVAKATLLRTLDELRQEHHEVAEDVTNLRKQLADRESRCRDLIGAIEALKRLTNGEGPSAAEVVPEPETEPAQDEYIPEGSPVSGSSPIAKYIKRGGEGRRLSSTSMIVDVVEEVDKAITRDALKDAFFEKFSREEMQRFWDRPDNAFGTALSRAVKDKLIVRGQRADGTEIYGSHALAERLRRQKAESASSNPGAEEEK